MYDVSFHTFHNPLHPTTNHPTSQTPQGLGFALTTVSALGLLIERSPDLTADIGRQEMLVGLSFVVAPAIGAYVTFIRDTNERSRSARAHQTHPHQFPTPNNTPGGLLYTYVGFASIFLLMSLAFALVALLLAGALRSHMLSPPRGARSRSGSSTTASAAAAAGAVGGGCLLQAMCCPIGRCRGRQRRPQGPALHLDESEGEEEEAAQGAGLLGVDGDDDEERGRRAPLLPSPSPTVDHEGGGAAIGLWTMLRVPGVLAACLVVGMSFHTIGFLEVRREAARVGSRLGRSNPF